MPIFAPNSRQDVTEPACLSAFEKKLQFRCQQLHTVISADIVSTKLTRPELPPAVVLNFSAIFISGN